MIGVSDTSDANAPDSQPMAERNLPVRVQRVLRCTYCREWMAIDEFTREGDHVIPASMGGEWIDHSVCGRCNTIANDAADALISQDFLVRFLRSFYEIPDRNGKIPCPPMIPVPAGGGVIKVALGKDGPVFTAGLPSSAFEELALDNPNDVERLREIVDEALGPGHSPDEHELRSLARRGQPLKTPQPAWSRFMAKLGLACGREAFGDDWLDSRQARILSTDLLSDRAPRFSQRWHYPPVEEAWPYEPPKHRLWIEPYEDTAMLKIARSARSSARFPSTTFLRTRIRRPGRLTRTVQTEHREPTGEPGTRCISPAQRSAFNRRAVTACSSPTPTTRSSTSRTAPTGRSISASSCRT
jgi:hypothetical protein